MKSGTVSRRSNQMSYQIHVLKMGQCEVRGPEVYWMEAWDDWETLYFYMVVAQGEGKTIIVNSGPPRDLTALNARWTAAFGPRGALVRTESEWPERALARLGVAPQDVHLVLITPLQAYAVGNVPLFRNAEIGISRRGWIEDFHAPAYAMHVPRKLRIPDDVLSYLVVEVPEKVRLLEDEEQILPGLSCFWAGTHHRSSMVYVFETAAGRVAVTDCCFKYGNIERMHPLGIMESLPECMAAYQRIRRSADIVVPLYDPEVLKRFPDGRIA
jgi:glyoxylase-like metal-dependent hydrolase (beta-lactamase superfamily II)